MKKKMLVIDDEPGVLDMIQGHFKHRGFEIYTADDGLAGIEICRKVKPDVILLDLKMKEMDGDEAVPQLKALVPEAVVFMISAYQDERLHNRIKGLGIDAYFEKPVSILELQRAVESALQRSNS